jgi:predicted amidohydrolase YtcJ
MSIDTILYNGNVHTMDPRRPRAQAVVIRQGRVVTAGMDKDLRDLIRPGVEAINLEGRTVIPGLCDAHLHFVSAGQVMQQVDHNDLPSLEEAIRRVGDRVAKTPKGQWIFARGWDQTEWAENRYPTAADLDRVSPDNPVACTRTDGHLLWVNSLAMQMAGITRDTPDPDGGHIDRDEQGAPTGVLRENAQRLVRGIIPATTRDNILEFTREAIAYAHRHGITAVHDMSGSGVFGDHLWAYQVLKERGELNLRILAQIPGSDIEHAVALGIRTGLGDEWIRLGAVKVFADGTLGSQTALMLAPFENSENNTGIAVTPLEELHRISQKAIENGLSIAVHAIGDRANREMLDIFEELRPSERQLRCRIEHCQTLDAADIPRFQKLGVVASMQPCHQPADMANADRFWGKERAAHTYAFRSLLNTGAVLAFGSDAPVEPMDMLPNIHAAVTRTRKDGTPPGGWNPAEKLTVEEAVRGFTMGAAYASGVEKLKGSLSPRKVADLAILHEDIFTIDPNRIWDVKVDMTVVNGKVVYERKS